MRPIDLSPLYRSTVGFDRLFNLFDSVTGFDQATPGYPPYNIERLSESEYRISMAVAGFSQDEIRVDVRSRPSPSPAPRSRRRRSAGTCTAGLPRATSSAASSSPTTWR
jgi:hypothetical protein